MARQSLKGVEVKLAMARRHLQVFLAEFTDFAYRDLYQFTVESHDGGRRWVYKLASQPALPEHWQGIFGDMVHNLRSALDHLAYQLVLLDGGQPNETTQFPIRSREFRFVDGVAEPTVVIDGVSDVTLAEVRSAQPYNEPGGPKHSPLWWLHQLDVIDKHRHLVIQLAAVQFVLWEQGRSDSEPQATIHLTRRPLKKREVVLVLSFDVPVPDPRPNISRAVQPMLGDVGPKPARHMQIPGLSANLYGATESVIDRFRPRFGVPPVSNGSPFAYTARLFEA